MSNRSKLRVIKVIHNNKVEVINFDNISKINVQYKDRIVLNYNHSITRNQWSKGDNPTKSTGKFSGYYYIDKSNTKNYNEIVDMLYFDEKFKDVFYPTMYLGKITGFVNVNEISSVKFCEDRLSVIFNLSNSVTAQKDNPDKLESAESVISIFSNIETYTDYFEEFCEDYIV